MYKNRVLDRIRPSEVPWYLGDSQKSGDAYPNLIFNYNRNLYAIALSNKLLEYTFSDTQTFTRSTYATGTSSLGLITGYLVDKERLEYSTSLRGLLMEESRENLFNYSEDIEDWGSANSGATIDADDATSPDGTKNADALNVAASTISGYFKFGIPTTAATAYAFSFFIKHKSGNTVLRTGSDDATAFGTGTAARFDFDTSDNSFSNVGAQVTDYGYEDYGDYVRVYGVLTTVAGDTSTSFILYNGDASGVASFNIWGLQLEEGSTMSSYIPTDGATVTRTADNNRITDLTTFNFDETEGTLYIHGYKYYERDFPSAIEINNGSSDERLRISFNNSNQITAGTRTGGSTTSDIATAEVFDDKEFRAAISYKTNEVIFAVNGSEIGTDTSVAMPSGLDRMGIGMRPDNFANQINGVIYDIRWYPTTMTVEELEDLTDPLGDPPGSFT